LHNANQRFNTLLFQLRKSKKKNKNLLQKLSATDVSNISRTCCILVTNNIINGMMTCSCSSSG